jgi:flagellar motor switch protein FliG
VDKQLLMQGVANKLFAAESTIDSALADTAALLTEMVEARKAARVSSTVDAKATAKVVEAMAALSAARTAMVEAHEEMSEVKLRLGVRTMMIGTYDKTKGSAVAADQMDRAAV